MKGLLEKIFSNKKSSLAVLWFLFTTSLGTWWVYFSYKQYTSLKLVNWENSEKTLSYQKMLIQEGLVFLLLVILGGGALIYYFLKESKLLQERESFFAAFTHDLKTTISTQRLTLENLIQSHKPFTSLEYKKMFSDSQALGLRLENALNLSQKDRHNGVYTSIQISEVVSSIKRMWPELEINLNKDATIYVDKVFLISVLMNLFQNAVQHAQATEVSLVLDEEKTKLKLSMASNGSDFNGDISKLGQSYYYRGTYKGSGLGLYISKSLMKKMNGDLIFRLQDKKLVSILEFKKIK